MTEIRDLATEQTTLLTDDWFVLQTAAGVTKKIKATNTKLVGYDDYLMVQDPTTTNSPNSPALATFIGNIKFSQFANGSAMNEIFGAIHIQHTYVAGTPISIHIHWSHNIAVPVGNVKWNIDYTIAKGFGSEVFAAPTTISLIQPAGAQYLHHIIESTDITSAAIEVDSLVLLRIWRDPADVADTFDNPVFFLRCDAHFKSDNRVTNEKVRPFTKV